MTIYKCILLIYAVIVASFAACAQPKAAGMDISFSGAGFSYEHILDNDSFLNISLKGELSEVFLNNTDTPGFSASLSYNYIIKRWKSVNDNDICLFAGPGVTIGKAKDYKENEGYFFGLKGRGGIECSFSRNVVISACISPVIGMHMMVLRDYIKMQYYRYGLLYTLMPEIGIRYRF